MIANATPRRALGWRSLLVTAVLVSAAAILFAGLFTAFGSENPEELGWDFRMAYYPAAGAVAHGESPYPDDPNDPTLNVQSVYAYPPQLAFLVSPLAALPPDVAAVVAVLVSFAALIGALALVGVRDPRCYAVIVLWAPGWNALEMANISALLALLLALVWRYRETRWPLAAALGAMVSLKLFLWPLLVWAVASRRSRAAVLAVALGLGLTAFSWAAIGFAGLRTYPDLLDRVATQESYSILDVVEALGLGTSTALVFALALTGLLLALCVRYVRVGDDERAFFAAVVAALVASPILWLHYLVLLAVPLALVRPRFSALWLLPVVLWFAPRSGNGEGAEPFLVGSVVATLAFFVLARPSKKPVAAEAASR